MKPETDFKKWLTYIDSDDAGEVHELYYVLRNKESDTRYLCEHLGGERYLISCTYIDEELLISSKKQMKYLIEYLENTYGDGDVEANYGFQMAMEKND